MLELSIQVQVIDVLPSRTLDPLQIPGRSHFTGEFAFPFVNKARIFLETLPFSLLGNIRQTAHMRLDGHLVTLQEIRV